MRIGKPYSIVLKYDGKEFEICIVDLEFESGHAPLVRVWDRRGFTPSLGPTKFAFRKGEVSSNPKKKLCLYRSVRFSEPGYEVLSAKLKKLFLNIFNFKIKI